MLYQSRGLGLGIFLERWKLGSVHRQFWIRMMQTKIECQTDLVYISSDICCSIHVPARSISLGNEHIYSSKDRKNA